MNRLSASCHRLGLAAAAAVLLLAGALTPAYAQPAAPPIQPVQVAAAAAGALISWSLGAGAADPAAVAAAAGLPLARYQGYVLPLRTEAFVIGPEGEPAVQIAQLNAEPYAGSLQPAPLEIPPVLDWQPDPNAAPNAAPDAAPSLPAAPVFLVRQTEVDGHAVVVIGISPIFQQNGVTMMARAVTALLPGAAPLDAAALQAAGAAPKAAEAVVVPKNQAALQPGYKVIVAKFGIQEILSSAFASADWNNRANLRVTVIGQEVAAEVQADRVRFYAPAVGDRWNATSTYWITFASQNGAAPLRMQTLSDAPGAGVRTTAIETGRWIDNRVYESVYPGPDGDHWFNASLAVTGNASAASSLVTLPLSATLPVVDGQSTFTVAVTAYTRPAGCVSTPTYRIATVFWGAASPESQNIDWSPITPSTCAMQQNWQLPLVTASKPVSMALRLVSLGYAAGIKVDSVSWQRPVSLDFRNASQGAAFATPADAATYNLANLPAVWKLYDVTDGRQPGIVPSNGASFNQAAGASGRRYFLANLAAPQQPAVSAQAAIDFSGVRAADAIYIGPAGFQAALQPLLALRQSEHFTPLFVDIQQVFDVYGFGQFSAAALRNFLRAETNWQDPVFQAADRHIAVTLVGDATYDPFSFEGTVPPNLNPNLVPAYMDERADVNMKEAPCDACLAQLNGDDPITGDGANGFVPDIWLGRFPVRSNQELTDVVAKIVSYETATDDHALWRSRYVFLADNYIQQLDDQNNAKVDAAGDFASAADATAALLPPQVTVQRVYYDPAPQRRVILSNIGTPVPAQNGNLQTEPLMSPGPGHISNRNLVHDAAMGALNGGAAMVIYNGHSNHWQYADIVDGATVPANTPRWLLNTVDAEFTVNNAGRFYIGLEMTCYSAQFTKPANSGTIDELLFRKRDGGAVAMFGSAGITLAEGHEYLQQGFVRTLFAATTVKRMGELVSAAYAELRLNDVDGRYLDAQYTFLLFGDPLTRARVGRNASNYLPLVRR